MYRLNSDLIMSRVAASDVVLDIGAWAHKQHYCKK